MGMGEGRKPMLQPAAASGHWLDGAAMARAMRRVALAGMVGFAMLPGSGQAQVSPSDADTIAELRRQLEEMHRRLEQLEARTATAAPGAPAARPRPAPAQARAPAPAPAPPTAQAEARAAAAEAAGADQAARANPRATPQGRRA